MEWGSKFTVNYLAFQKGFKEQQKEYATVILIFLLRYLQRQQLNMMKFIEVKTGSVY